MLWTSYDKNLKIEGLKPIRKGNAMDLKTRKTLIIEGVKLSQEIKQKTERLEEIKELFRAEAKRYSKNKFEYKSKRVTISDKELKICKPERFIAALKSHRKTKYLPECISINLGKARAIIGQKVVDSICVTRKQPFKVVSFKS